MEVNDDDRLQTIPEDVQLYLQKTSPYRIALLIITNFKSYKGNHVIGPFKRFTGVIGPNGAGKSNLMDAISFVLGVQARHMRGSSLTDLIYSSSNPLNEEDEQSSTVQNVKEASVALVIQKLDDENFSSTFSRHIIRSGAQSILKINGTIISSEGYQEELAKFNVFVKARNFLVFQGDVVEIAQKSPADLGQLFEQISGSILLKSDFEVYENEVKTISTDLRHLMFEKQRIESQAGELKNQVTEVKSYRQLEKDLVQARTDFLIYQLYVNETLAGVTKKQLENAEVNMKEIEIEKLETTQLLRGVDADMTKCKIEKKKLVDVMKSNTNKLTHFDNMMGQMTEKINFKTKELMKEVKVRDHSYTMKKSKENLKESYLEDLNEIENKICELNETEKMLTTKKIKYTKEQREEYQKLKHKVAILTSNLQSNLIAQENKKKTKQMTLSLMETELLEIEQKIKKMRENEALFSRQIQKYEDEMNSMKSELEEKEMKLLEGQNDFDQMNKKQNDLLKEQQKIEIELNKCHAGRREAGRLQKAHDLLLNLQEVFPTNAIYGMLGDLCQPSNKKYSIALMIALGKFYDCIVVDTFVTAKKAVDYLKKQKKGVLEFAALDSIIVPPFDSRLKSLVTDSCRLALDCADYDPMFDKAFKAALNDSFLVESLKEAEHLAYVETVRKNLRVKVVTLEGEKILKSGNIAIDTAIKSVDRFDRNEFDRLTSTLKTVDQKLKELGDSAEIQQRVFELRNEVEGLKVNLESKLQKLEMWRERQRLTSTENKQSCILRERHLQRKLILEKELAECDEELEKINVKRTTIEDEIFAPLAREVDIQVLRRESEEEGSLQKDREEEKHKLSIRETKIRSELKRLEVDIEDYDIEALDMKIEKMKKEIHKYEMELNDVKRNKIDYEKSIESTKEKLLQIERDEKILEVRVQEKKQKLNLIQKSLNEMKNEITKLNQQSEISIKEATDLLKMAILDGLYLPLLKGTLKGYGRLLGLEDLIVMSQTQQPENNGDVIMSIEDGSTNNDDEELPEIDYENVLSKQQLESCDNPNTIKSIKIKMEEKIGSLRSELSKKIPNLKAVEKYESLLSESKTMDSQIAHLGRQKQKKEKKFQVVRKERNRRFKNCFDHIQKAIDKIYHHLTGGETEEVFGGQAYLELIDGSSTTTSDCYQSGILYSVMPPSKRFSEIKRLSGGEKTMAALALLFALQSYKPSPFFVLDEIDADLDPINVFSLADYLRNVQFQVIVISHSDRVFSQADALIGVYIDTSSESSDTLTLDLSVYPRVAQSIHHHSKAVNH